MQLIPAATEMRFIPITAEQVPCALLCKLVDKTYRLTFNYNEDYDFFTVDLEINNSADNIPLVYGEILHLNKPCFEAFNDERYPLPVLVPLCLSGDSIERITYDSFGSIVKLYVVDRPASGGGWT
ncbi:hypothetical protein LJC42_06955 [Eubacteriales bacterium OttesenSCG-928-K08]|nr:hypothetical protein [Eubacteriales bacterium OttesenSCG-928-K08]